MVNPTKNFFYSLFGVSSTEQVKSEEKIDIGKKIPSNTPPVSKKKRSSRQINRSSMGKKQPSPPRTKEEKLPGTLVKETGVGSFVFDNLKYTKETLVGTGKKGLEFLDWGKQGLVGAGKWGIEAYVKSYEEGYATDKAQLITPLKEVISKKDPQFLKFYDMVSSQLIGYIKNQIETSETEFVKNQVLPHVQLVLDLFEINLARIFANLATQFEHSTEHPLVALFSLISEKASPHINAKLLNEIEEKYRKARTDLSILTKKNFPNLDKEPAKQKLIQRCIENGPKFMDEGKYLIDKLFPDENEEKKAFLRVLERLNRRHEELGKVFDKVSESVLQVIVPNLEIPGILQWLPLQTIIHELLKGGLTKFFHALYVDSDHSQQQECREVLQKSGQIEDEQPLIKTSQAMAFGFFKDYLQSHPELIANKLPLSQISQPSQQEFAGWILGAVQGFSNSKNEHLLILSEFFKERGEGLILALLAQGTKTLIPEGNKFIRELLDGKFDQPISDDLLKDFVDNLPLPPILKNMLIPLLSDQVKKWQPSLLNEWQTLQMISKDAEKEIISTLPNESANFISLLDKLIDQLVEKGIEKTGDKIQDGELLETLLARYAPDIKIDDSLKNWLVGNINTLQESKFASSTVFFKGVVRAMALRVLANALKNNIKDPNQKYLVQVLNNIDQVISSVIREVNNVGKEQWQTTLALQKQIQEKQETITQLQDEIEDSIQTLADRVLRNKLSPEELSLLEQPLKTYRVILDIQGKIDALKKKKEEEVFQLGQLRNIDESQIEAISFLKKELGGNVLLEDIQVYRDRLHLFVQEYKEFLGLSKEKLALQILERYLECQKLIPEREINLEQAALTITPEGQKIFLEIVKSSEALKIAEQQLEFYNGELKVQEDNLDKYNKKVDEKNKISLSTRPDWEWGMQWLTDAKRSLFKIGTLSKQTSEQQQELDTHLFIFKDLSKQVLDLFGFNQLELPPLLDGVAKPYRENLENRDLPRFLFKQLGPVILTVSEIDSNRRKLEFLSKNDPFLSSLVTTLPQEVLGRLPEFLDPKTIGETIKNAFPNVPGLDVQITDQVQNLMDGISTNDPQFAQSSELLKRYIEGTILKLLVKIAEPHTLNQSGILEAITGKLIKMIPSVEELKDKTSTDVAHEMVDRVLAELLHISSPQDLEALPFGLTKTIYEKIKSKTHEQLVPLVKPMIERVQDRKRLEDLSGSEFLGSLSAVLPKDLFTMLPKAINSYEEVGEQLFQFISLETHSQAPQKAREFTQEIVNLIKDQVPIDNASLVEIYIKVTGIIMPSREKQRLQGALDTWDAKGKINAIRVTSEEIGSMLAQKFPHVNPNLLNIFVKAFVGEVQGLIHDHPAYKNISNFFESYLEGVFLKLMIRIAEKNPSVNGKDSVMVLTEKVLAVSAKAYLDINLGRPFNDVAKEVNDKIMKEFLGIDSPNSFEGLPAPIQKAAYGLVENYIGELLLGIQLQTIAPMDVAPIELQTIKQESRDFGVDSSNKTYLETLSEDLTNYAWKALPGKLSEIQGVVGQAPKNIETKLKKLSEQKIKTAGLILNYPGAQQLKQTLEDVSPKVFQEVGQKTAPQVVNPPDVAKNFVFRSLNEMFKKVVEFETNKGAEFYQTLATNALKVITDHFVNLKGTKDKATREQHEILHKDFVETVGQKLHPGVPKTEVSYAKTLDAIEAALNLSNEQKIRWNAQKEDLRKTIHALVKRKPLNLMSVIDVIRVSHSRLGGDLSKEQLQKLMDSNLLDLIDQERAALKLQRQTGAGVASRKVLKMLFPNGKNDLTFIPKELRSQVWQLFKDQLPTLLPMMFEKLLDPNTINKVVLNLLEKTRDSLNKEIVLSPAQPPIVSIKTAKEVELDKAVGGLIGSLINVVKLPPAIKNQICDRRTGEVLPGMQEVIGKKVRETLQATLIQDNLETLLQKLVERDANNNFLLKFDAIAAPGKSPQEIQAGLKKVSREIVDASISYAIKSTWANAQRKFDDLIKKIFGNVGTKLKQALDAVFGFIFFKIIGAVLSLLLSPAKAWLKTKIYQWISLDANRDRLMQFFTQAPTDQPLTEKGHVVYNEDLIFKLGDVLTDTIEQALNQPIPQIV